jgi:hypothetical protein
VQELDVGRDVVRDENERWLGGYLRHEIMAGP